MDFSQFGETSEEWASYVSAHPIINQSWTKPDESLREMHISGTAIRAKLDGEKLKAYGLQGKFTTHDHEVTTRDGSSIPLRVYAPNNTPPSEGRPIYVYLHGGGFLHGSVDTEGSFCASVATSLDILVMHPCPRLVHEAKYPTTHHDAWDAIEWILDHADALGGDLNNLVIGGVSSGANLAASATQQFCSSDKCAAGAARLKGQVLVVPWLIQPDAFPYHLFADPKKTSLIQCSDALGLSTARLKWLSETLEAKDITDPLINPPLADNNTISSLPKTAIIVAGGDPLRDDGLLYATRLKEAGVKTKVHVFTGMPHHFTVYDLPHPHVTYDLPSAKISQLRVLESIRWALANGDEGSEEWKIEPDLKFTSG